MKDPVRVRSRLPFLIMSALIVTSPGAQPGLARSWNPSPKDLAQDYTTIQHSKTPHDLMQLEWLTSRTMETKSAPQMFDRYVILDIVDAHSAVDGTITFADISTLQANDGDGNALKLLTGDSIPPAVAGEIAALQAVFGRSLGALGKGVRWFVFDAGAVRVCTKGRLAIPYGGETYTFDTPIPGCPVI